jgi:MoaA/NifB/PqqE/SkfB family radical SAM enzyme
VDERDAIAGRVVRREAGDDVGPWTLELYPTLRCNLDCAFCDTTDRHRPAVAERSPVAWAALVDEAADLGARRIMVLGGGEPLLSPATPEILRAAKRRGLEGFLTTNGTRLDDATANLLVELGWDDVHVSIDGATADTHDRLRGKPGAFRRTVSALCRLRRARDAAGRALPRLAIHCVLTRLNVDELPALVRLAAALGCHRVELDALVAYRPEQRALALDARARARLPDALAEATVEAERLGLSHTFDRFAAGRALARGTAPPTTEPDGATAHPLGAAPCLKAWHHLVVDAAGRTSACCVLAGEGDPLNDDPGPHGAVRAVWAGPWIEGLRAAMRAGTPPPRCAECSENILVHERAIRARLGSPA